MIRYQHLLAHAMHDELANVISFIYRLDVYITVGRVAAAKGFCVATALPAEKGVLIAEGLCHPCVGGAKGNNLSFDRNSNLLFLTGANMAGKSTLMKAFGIAVYLGHMGFPVAAREMAFSVRDGLYSSINVADDLSQGYSHFYAEVLRVKKVAEAVASRGKFVVLFDELFKGTNVKDAYDATVAVTEGFAQYRDSLFIISTHIIEAGEVLGQRCRQMQSAFLPTVMDGKRPIYTYTLQQGITADRHGMMIIQNEGILELILHGEGRAAGGC